MRELLGRLIRRFSANPESENFMKLLVYGNFGLMDRFIVERTSVRYDQP